MQTYWAKASQNLVFLRLLLSVLSFFAKSTYISKSKGKEKVGSMRRINCACSNSHPENPCLLASYCLEIKDWICISAPKMICDSVDKTLS